MSRLGVAVSTSLLAFLACQSADERVPVPSTPLVEQDERANTGEDMEDDEGSAAPQGDDSDLLEAQSERGAAEALAAIEDGRVRILYFGEPAPDDHVDRETGLPSGSMGCEWDAETNAYMDAFNETTIAWWTEHSPFEDGGAIAFRRRGAGENLRVEIARDAVRVAHGGGQLHTVDSSWRERTSLAAWVGVAELDASDEDVPSPFDTLAAGGVEVRWPLSGTPPVDPRAIRLIVELAGRPAL